MVIQSGPGRLAQDESDLPRGGRGPSLLRDGRFIETVGRYNLQMDLSTISLDAENIQERIGKGVAEDSVKRLMKAQGI